jgi:hypothetical protein
MRLKGLVLVIFLLAAASVASADTLTITGVGGNSLGGVYVAPYNFTVNGSSTTLICDDYWDEVNPPQTWNAAASTFTTLANVYFSGGTGLTSTLSPVSLTKLQAYEAVAWLAQQIFILDKNSANNLQVAELNWAIWEIFDPSFLPNSSYYNNLNSTQKGQINNLVAQATSNYASGNYSNMVIYTPTGESNGYLTPGAPQEFFGEVPEPGVLLLVAIGLCSLVAFRRRIALV